MLETSQRIADRVTVRLEDDLKQAAEQLLSSGKSKTTTDALKYLMRSGEKVTISEVSSDLDKLMKIQLQTLALLKRYVGSNDENLINLSKSDARSMYQQFRDHEAF